MKVRSFLRRCSYTASAVAMTATTMFPSLMGATTYAFPTGGQVTTRSIKLSSSKVSATSVSYNVKFNVATAHTVRGIVVDFCANSPIVGDATCTAPTGFTVGTPTVTYQQGIAGYTAASANTGRTLKLSNATGTALAAGAVVEFTLTTATNTSTLGTFYGRIITYNAEGVGTDFANYAPGTEGSTSAIDYGGVALSTANELTITAKVQESLVFCVYTTGATCSVATGSAVALGDANGVLSNYATNYTNTARFSVGSNASGGVVVNLKGENLCRVATPCTNTDLANIIERSGDVCTADSTVTSVEQFGLRVSAAGTGVTADAGYACAASSHAFDRTNAMSTYGDVLASTAGPGDEVQSTIELMAKAATTTQAGIYTTKLSMIATGTY